MSNIRDKYNAWLKAGGTSAPALDSSTYTVNIETSDNFPSSDIHAKYQAWLNNGGNGLTHSQPIAQANSGAIDAQSFRALDNAQMHPTIPTEYMPAVFHQIEQNDMQDYHQWRDSQMSDILGWQQNPEYNPDGYTQAIGRYMNLAQQKNDELKAVSTLPAIRGPSEQQAFDLQNQADELKAKNASIMFDPNPYADYAGFIDNNQQIDNLQKQHNSIVNDPNYADEIYGTTRDLAAPGKYLSNDQKRQAQDAVKVFNKGRDDQLKMPYLTDGMMTEAPGSQDEPLTDQEKQKYTNQGVLSSLLTNKASPGAAIVAGGLSAVPGILPLFKAISKNTKGDEASDPVLNDYAKNTDSLYELQQGNPLAFGAGSTLVSFGEMALGGKALSSLADEAPALKFLNNPVTKNEIIMGTQSMLNSLSNGEDAPHVIANTVASVLGARFGTKIGGQIADEVVSSLAGKMSDKALRFVASTANGISFATTQTAWEEGKNAAMAAAYGKPYNPDLISIASNYFSMLLFGSLESFKSDPTAAKIQKDLKAGKKTAEQAGVDYLNEKAAQAESISRSKESLSNCLPDSTSTSIDTNPATHTPKENQVINGYTDSVDENLVQFINNSIKYKGENSRRYMLKPVSDRAASDIKTITGIDATGFRTVIEQRVAEHIVKEHGGNGVANQSMADINDIARIQFVIDNYDAMIDAGTSAAYTTNKPNGRTKQAPTVEYAKKVNGTYYVIEAVPDTKAKTVYITTAYMYNSASGQNKTGASRLPDANSPGYTSENGSANAPVNITIPQNVSDVKSQDIIIPSENTPKSADEIAREYIDQMHGLANSDSKGYNGNWEEEYNKNVFGAEKRNENNTDWAGGTESSQSDSAPIDLNTAEKIKRLDDFIKTSKIEDLPLTSKEILKITYGDLQLAKNLVEATKEVIPGKTVLELVDIFQIPHDPKPGSLSSYQTRIWYKWQESMFDWRLDYNKPLKQVARDAFNMRNEARTKARDLMSDRELAEALKKNDENLTFEELVKDKINRKNLSGDDIWLDIIESSKKSRDRVDRLFGLIWG